MTRRSILASRAADRAIATRNAASTRESLLPEPADQTIATLVAPPRVTTPTVEIAHEEPFVVYNEDTPRREQRIEEVDREPASKRVKMTKVSEMMALPEFGNFKATEMLTKFRDWMKVVRNSLSFAVGWDEKMTANWFKVACGQNLRTAIDAYKLDVAAGEKPFSELIENIEKRFEQLADPTLEYRAFASCKQEPGEATNDYFLRLMRTTRYMDIGEGRLRTHFISSMRNESLRNMAIAMNWSLDEVVAAATRTESWDSPGTSGTPGGVAAVTQRNNDVGGLGGRPAGLKAQDRSDRQRTGGPCKSCGNITHRNTVCPAVGKSCLKCGAVGHFSRVCPGKKQQRFDKRPRNETKTPGHGASTVNQVSTNRDWVDQDWD